MTKEWSLKVLKEYLTIPSISAQGKGIKESVRFLVKLFRSLGIQTRVITSRGNPVVFGEIKVNEDLPTILFYNHYDVQPPEPLSRWTSPPFCPTIRGGRLYARGSSDNKGNLIARLSAVKSFRDKGERLPVNVKFLIDGEEEIGSPTLPQFLKRYSHLVAADLCIWESGGRDEKGHPDLALGCKGICCLELTCQYPRGDLHSSKGVIIPNPAWRLIWALATIKDKDENILIKGFYNKVKRLNDEDRNILKPLQFYEDKKRKTWGIKKFLRSLTGPPLKERYFYQPALNINGLTSGYEGEGHKTVLPNSAKAKIDFRLVPNQTPQEVIKLLRRHLDTSGFPDVMISNQRGYPPARTPIKNRYLKLITQSQERVYRKPVMIEPLSSASGPMFLFAPLMPCFSLGVGYSGSNIHAPDENIKIADLWLGIRCIKEILSALRTNK